MLDFNAPVSTYDGITSLCGYSSRGEVWKVFTYVHGGTDAALSVYIVKSHFVCFWVRTCNILFMWKWQQSECVDTKISSITEDSIQKMLGMMSYLRSAEPLSRPFAIGSRPPSSVVRPPCITDWAFLTSWKIHGEFFSNLM